MHTWSYVLAAALLTSPPDTVEPPIDAADWPTVQEAVQSLAVEWEILDQREVPLRPRSARGLGQRFDPPSPALSGTERRSEALRRQSLPGSSHRERDARIQSGISPALGFQTVLGAGSRTDAANRPEGN